jgi:exopolysaccharide biosynthesis predicted pyruvyltransferase EpsI
MQPRPIDGTRYADLRHSLLELARQRAGRLVYVPNRGNAGDALIASAAWQFFDELPQAPVCLPIEELRSGDRAIFGGGGVFVPAYPAAARWLQVFARAGLSGLVILPQTFRGNEAELAELGPECTLFCREWVSYDFVERIASRCDVRFAPDLALGLDIAALRARLEAVGRGHRAIDQIALLYSSSARRYRRWLRKLAAVEPDAAGRLEVFRSDAERTAAGGEKAQLTDVSDFYGSGFRERLECDRITLDLLDLLDTAQLVETNRLHVGIGAALLGKQVILHDNSYGKLRAIYDASLKDWPNVSFAD